MLHLSVYGVRTVDREAKFCLVSLLLLALITSQADGANTQGLYWGLNSGDRLDYTYQMHVNLTYTVASLNERLYIIVNGLPTLPHTVTFLQEAMCYNVSAYWANGSLVRLGGTNVGLPGMMFFAVGNWPLLTDIVSAAPYNGSEIIDDPSVWGIRSGYAIGSTQNNATWTFSKSDGATIEYSSLMLDLISDTEIIHVQLDRVVEGVSTTVLVSAAIISAEIIVAVLIIRRYRH